MTTQQKQTIPWIEKYRPTQFDNIVLDPLNRTLFRNMIENNYFPNLLFYGPGGTGKTSTIINLIQEYQAKYYPNNSTINKGNVIHLNASDERGIEIIRNQIHQFISTKNLFDSGLKLVVLDEVDSMTKNAQQALKYLLQITTQNVRFCLICNYISKIDESLQNEFICIRFNQLPKTDIFSFIKTICEKEDIVLGDEAIQIIQQKYHSDIRSMINFLQSNHYLFDAKKSDVITNTITNETYQELHRIVSVSSANTEIETYIRDICKINNVDKKQFLQNYFNYTVRYYPECVSPTYLQKVEILLHGGITEDPVPFFKVLFTNK